MFALTDNGTNIVTACIAAGALLMSAKAAKNSKPVSNGFVSSVDNRFEIVNRKLNQLFHHFGLHVDDNDEADFPKSHKE